MDSWSTHLPVLVTFAARTRGPVLEMGCGDSSTPILHGFCRDRFIMSVDGDAAFIERFRHLTGPSHLFHHVPDWSKFDVRGLGPIWEIAFIDHAPYQQRIVDLDRLRNRAKFLILHDAQAPEYQKILSTFKHRINYTFMSPATTVVSDIADPWDVWRD
jgi:hypothetical protein